MKKYFFILLLLVWSGSSFSQGRKKHYETAIEKTIYDNYKGMIHQPSDLFPFPYTTPGSVYSNELWDWDSWLSSIALRQITLDKGDTGSDNEVLQAGKGCIKNFLHYATDEGYIPIVVWHNANPLKDLPEDIYNTNMHKPVIAQHAAFWVKEENGNAEWIRPYFKKLESFIHYYYAHHRHEPTGLFYFQDDAAVGVDTDPSVFYRPEKSSGNIFLNCLMYKELKAMAYLSERLGYTDAKLKYTNAAQSLKDSIQEHCWDERDGFFYSVDLNLLPIDTITPRKLFGIDIVLHKNHPRTYNCLIQRLGVWTGFLALWAGVATPEQAKRIVNEHYLNNNTFHAPYGVRSLSKMEKMYSIYASGNPSDAQGPVWINTNYLVFKGLVKYGFTKEAKALAGKTVKLLGEDAIKEGAFHEYYDPESGAPILNKGFQNWNYLVMNMIAWLEKKKVVSEF